MAAGAIYTLLVGEDANWDWQNYHEYNVWAVLTGRYHVDALPAGFQTYFNPAIYFPVYYLRHDLPAPIGLAIIGAVHGLNLWLIYVTTRVALARGATWPVIMASLLIAATGAMTLSEVGTSFSDIVTSLPIIGGVILLMRAEERPRIAALLAGVLIGAAVGLKLTNVVFAIGAAAAVLASTRPLVMTLWLAIGGMIGAVATGGAWSLMLWRETGNPIFPLFNGVFQSPDLNTANILDTQFMPHGWLDALAYPFYWLAGDNRSSEYPFRDARFAVAMVLAVAAIGLRFIKRGAMFTQRDIVLLVFVAVSYATWLGLFSIHRYIVTLELLCGPVITILVVRILRQTEGRLWRAVLPVTALAIALWTQPGDWWRRPWSDPYRPELPQAFAQPAHYFLLDKPMGYVAPLFPPQSRFFQIADVALPILPGGQFDRRIRDSLATPLPGGAWAMHLAHRTPRNDLLTTFGLARDSARDCVDVPSVVPKVQQIVACPLKAIGPH